MNLNLEYFRSPVRYITARTATGTIATGRAAGWWAANMSPVRLVNRPEPRLPRVGAAFAFDDPETLAVGVHRYVEDGIGQKFAAHAARIDHGGGALRLSQAARDRTATIAG